MCIVIYFSKILRVFDRTTFRLFLFNALIDIVMSINRLKIQIHITIVN
jgi:hypothetical protein